MGWWHRMASSRQNTEYSLTQAQKDHFLAHGFVRLPNCFTREKAAEWTSDMWTRLGFSEENKDTWTSERIHMPHHRTEHVKKFAPRAWAGICELLGGEERVAEESAMWSDALIVNLGSKEHDGKEWPQPKQLYGWHVDGDFFVHFLDSREQGLLVIPLFSDIVPHAGGTVVSPDAIGLLAKHLYDHPEGVSPAMIPRGQTAPADGPGFYNSLIQQCHEFHEMTGNTGDVILMHPLMVHSASVNSLRIPRVITNPPVSLKEPFNFDRKDPKKYSLVEKKTLQALGMDRLKGWEIVGGREYIVPERLRAQEEMKKQELERLRTKF